MPVYEYECPICHRTIEDLRPVAMRDRTTICTCKGKTAPLGGVVMKRILTGGPALRFIGPGFYTTDYSGKLKQRVKEYIKKDNQKLEEAKEKAEKGEIDE